MRRDKVLFIVFVLLVYETKSAPASVEDNSVIVKYENEPNTGNGLYRFEYETSDGISRSESSQIKTDKDNNEYIVITGQYQYRDPDGMLHSVTYTADENGYKQEEIIIKKRPNIHRISPATLGSLVGGGLG